MKSLLILSFVLLCSCAAAPERPDLAGMRAEDRTLGDIAEFLTAVAGAGEVRVYEGLPHPGWEKDAYAAESRRADVIKFEGYVFYGQPLLVSREERQALTEIVLRKEGHLSFRGVKFCGGYHPDYAIIWETNGKLSGTLICFGCHEWKSFTPSGRLYKDIAPATYEALKAILAKHVAQRPKRQTK